MQKTTKSINPVSEAFNFEEFINRPISQEDLEDCKIKRISHEPVQPK